MMITTMLAAVAGSTMGGAPAATIDVVSTSRQIDAWAFGL